MSSVRHAPTPIEASRLSHEQGQVAPAGHRFEIVALLAYLSLVSLVSARHEPWGDETQTWRMAIDSNGLVDLYRNARYEGHPLLFHVLLQLIGHVSRSWWAAVVFHVAIAGVGAWLVLRYAPFTRLQKVLFIFGYFPAYEYAVLVRPYGLGMMLAFAACVAWTRSPRRTVWAGVLLTLLANTTPIGTMLAMALALAFTIDWIWPDGEAPRLSTRAIARSALLAGAAVLVVLWVAMAQVKPPPDAAFVVKPKAVTGFSRWDLGSVPTVELNALFPITLVREGVVAWNRTALLPLSSVQLGLLVIASVLVLLVGCLISARRRSALVFFVVGTTGYIIFFNFLFSGTTRHHGYLFVVWVLSAWLAWSGTPSQWPLLPRLSVDAEAIARRLFTYSLVIPVAVGVAFAVTDLRNPFADARQAAAAIRARGLDTVPIIAYGRLQAQPVAALLDRPLIFPLERKTRSFIVWGSAAATRGAARAVDSAATALHSRSCRVLVITKAGQEIMSSTARRGRAIYTSTRTPMQGDRTRVWLLSAPPSERCPAPRG